MAAQPNPNQNTSLRRSPASVDRGGSSPPSFPIFSSAPSSDSGSNLSSRASSLSGNLGPSPPSSSSGSARGLSQRRKHHEHARQKLARDMHNRALCKKALQENDAMVYLDGPQVYTCANCRTHLTSHDDIISKSFHGRHGRAYLFDQCVNITTGPAEDRRLITGLHSVSDIFCKRCSTLVGWTYAKAYEPSQKYKEGKFIVEKINLHLEESDYYTVDKPAGERGDKWRVRSMSWGSERSLSVGSYVEAVGSPSGVMGSPGGSFYARGRSGSVGGSSSHSSSYHFHRANTCPQTPTRRSPGVDRMMSPKSPRTPSDIIYEYKDED